MTREQINKAIREEAEKRWPHIPSKNKKGEEMMQLVGHNPHNWNEHLRKQKLFIEGAKFREELERTITASTNLQQQNTTQGLNNSEKVYRWVKAKTKPKTESEYVCKIRDADFDAMEGYYKVKWERGKWTMYSEDEISFKVIEWLEEINPNPTTELKAEEKDKGLMDSKETALTFAEWIFRNGYVYSYEQGWWFDKKGEGIKHPELFELFINDTNENI